MPPPQAASSAIGMLSAGLLVMRGLIDSATDGAELAGVIAHEFGHVAHHDSGERFGFGDVGRDHGRVGQEFLLQGAHGIRA